MLKRQVFPDAIGKSKSGGGEKRIGKAEQNLQFTAIASKHLVRTQYTADWTSDLIFRRVAGASGVRQVLKKAVLGGAAVLLLAGMFYLSLHLNWPHPYE